MTRGRFIGLSAACSIILAIAVIFLAGYYESPGLLMMQLAIIGIPTAVPFIILSAMPGQRLFPAIVCWTILVAGWGYVVHLDTQPYQGGGASLAPVLGIFACGGACLVAAVLLIWRSLRT